MLAHGLHMFPEQILQTTKKSTITDEQYFDEYNDIY